MPRFFSILIVIVALLAPALAREGRLELGPAFYEVSTEVETPHVKWGKPLADGPLRALIIAPRKTQRETVELWQRLSMQYTAIGATDMKKLGDPDTLEFPSGGTVAATEARLRQAVKGNYDVIVTCVSWKILPAEVVAALLAKVRAGAGLVVVTPGELAKEKAEGEIKTFVDSWKEIARPTWVLAGSRLDELPHYRRGEKDSNGPPDKVFDCYEAGQGRVLHVKTGGSGYTFLTPDIGDVPGAGQWDFEDQQAFAAKLLLWAAGRVPAVSVSALTFSPDASTARLVLDALPAAVGRRVDCRLTIRDRWGRVLAEPSQMFVLAQDKQQCELVLGSLKGGEHRVEVRLLNVQGEALWWGVWPVKVKPTSGIERLTLKSDEVKPGATVEGQVQLAGPPVRKAKLVFTVTDAHGRVVSVTERLAKSGPFSVVVRHPLTVYHELAVTLVDQDRVLDEAHTRFAVPIKGPGWDDFSFLFWHHATEGWIGRLVSRELSRKYLGDSLNCAAWQTPKRIEDIAWCVAEDGLWTMPYACHFGNYRGHGLIRGPCLSNTNLITEMTTKMREVGQRLRKFCPPGYDLGDENVLTHDQIDVCFSAECQASFRTYLKALYPSLNALNAEWDTGFKDWAEVLPITRQEAIEKKQVPRWVDHRMHMNSVFVNIHRLCRDATRESDPQARVGFEGPVGKAGYNGYDLWKFSRFMDFWGPYPYNWEWYDAPRSFCPKGYYGGVWFGGYPDTRYPFHTWPWTAVLNGMSAAWWFCGYDGSPFSALAPDLRPYPDFLAVVDQDIRRLKSGVGKLIMHADAEFEPVALHYSMESLYAGLAYGLTNDVYSHMAFFRRALENSGLPFRLVAPDQIVSNELSRFRVLVLPASLALSDAEAAAMRRFVTEGGVLVADVRPGITDEHGKMRKTGALDDLFGDKPDGLFAVRDIGKGKTIMMSEGAVTNANLAGKALGDLLCPLGITPRVTITDEKGQYVAAPTVYRDGNTSLLAWNAGSQRRWGAVQVQLPAPAWCYLADEGRCLGYTDKPVVDVDKTLRYRVLVCLPYAVDRMVVTRAADRHSDREHTFRFKLLSRGVTPGYHVLRITVTGPDGHEHSCYAANLAIYGGTGEYCLPLALNDPHGDWTLNAADVATGAQARVTWRD